MEFSFEAIARIRLDHTPGSNKSKHIATDFFLEPSENLDASKYMNDADVLTKEGSHAVTQCFIQGLVGNIHFAAEKGYRNDAEHLRYIISELEKGFSSVAHVENGNY